MSRGARYAAYLILAGVVASIDQLCKHLAVAYLAGSPPIEVLPVLKWFLVYNRGAAFGFLHEAGGFQHYLFLGVASAIVPVILVWLWRIQCTPRLLAWSLVLILAGGIGNLIDRLRFRHVVDFINLHYQDWYFPAFNIADMAITFGVAGYLIHAFLTRGGAGE